MSFLVFPNGCHVCEVEVDPATGAYQVVRYDAIEDVGRIVNPLIVHGQSHGGVVQGLGQAMLENCIYDRATGQMLAASFMDYGIPRADEVPSFGTGFNEVLTPTNPLGIKAGGEGGTVPALAALVGAICDALKDDGSDAYRNAGDAREGVARHPGRTGAPRPLIIPGRET